MRLISPEDVRRTYVTGSTSTLGLHYNEIHCKINKFNVGRGVFHRSGDQVWGINGWPDEVLRFKVRPLNCCSCRYLILDWGRVVFGKAHWRIRTCPNNYLIGGFCFSIRVNWLRKFQLTTQISRGLSDCFDMTELVAEETARFEMTRVAVSV